MATQTIDTPAVTQTAARRYCPQGGTELGRPVLADMGPCELGGHLFCHVCMDMHQGVHEGRYCPVCSGVARPRGQ